MIPTRNRVLRSLVLWASLQGCAPSSSSSGNADMPATDSGTLPPPGSLILSAVAPGIGPSAGGVMLTLAGQNFKSGATVSIGGLAAGQVTFLSETQLSASLPAKPGAFGLVPVAIQNPDGRMAGRSDLFSYYASSLKYTELPPFTVKSGPQQASVGDFNGDQNLDMVIPNSASDDISVLLGDGAGGFGSPTNYPTGHGAIGSAVGDFNGDRKPDIAIANYYTDKISVYLGNGTGGFGAATTLTTTGGPWSVALVDVNGDGKLDVVTVCASSNSVNVFLGDGAGKFGTVKAFSVGSNPRYSAQGDFNDDGKLDLAVSGYQNNTVSVVLGDGQGGFGPATRYSLWGSPTGVVTADFNGDQKLDLAIAIDYEISVFLGQGNGTFVPGERFSTGSARRNTQTALVMADLNGDRHLDLALTEYGGAKVLLGDAKGGFSAPYEIGGGAEDPFVTVADFDKDSKPDLVVTSPQRYRVTVLLNKSQ